MNESRGTQGGERGMRDHFEKSRTPVAAEKGLSWRCGLRGSGNDALVPYLSAMLAAAAEKRGRTIGGQGQVIRE